MFPTAIRLSTVDTNRVLTHGKRWSADVFRFTVQTNAQHANRYAVSVRSKKIKTAVGRAFTKRVIREWIRTHDKTLPQGFDCVLGCISEITKSNRETLLARLRAELEKFLLTAPKSTS